MPWRGCIKSLTALPLTPGPSPRRRERGEAIGKAPNQSPLSPRTRGRGAGGEGSGACRIGKLSNWKRHELAVF